MMRKSQRICIEVKTFTTSDAAKITKHLSKKKNELLEKRIDSQDQEDGVTTELNSERMVTATVPALPTSSRSKTQSIHSDSKAPPNSRTMSLRSSFCAETVVKSDVSSIPSLRIPRTSSTSVGVNSFSAAVQRKTLKTTELLVTEVKSLNKATSALFRNAISNEMKSPVRSNREADLTFGTPPPKLYPEVYEHHSNGGSDLEMPELDAVSVGDADILSNFFTRRASVISTKPESENILSQFNPTQLENRNGAYLVDNNLEAYRELKNAYGYDYVDIEEFSSASPVMFITPSHMQWVKINSGVFIYICFNCENCEIGYIRLSSKTSKPLKMCDDEYICYSLMDGQITVKSNSFNFNSDSNPGQPCLMSIKLSEGCQFNVPKNALYSLENWGEREASLHFTRVRQSNSLTHNVQ